MKTINSLFVALAMVLMTAMMASCSSDSDSDSTPKEDTEALLKTINKNYVQNVVRPTYEGLLAKTEVLKAATENLESQSELDAACKAWKDARQYWEWSEAFLFGPAHNFGIDPHIDTWPFDVKSFENDLKAYQPLADHEDAVKDNIRNGQNRTGFHALEYLIFRDGKNRMFADMSEDEITYAKLVAEDLYLSAVRLVANWGGKITEEQATLLEEEDYTPEEDYGDVLINAGSSKRYPTVSSGCVAILAGCSDIIGEVAQSKIGQPYDGSDKDYIESPHSYNSIQDFYDNTLGCLYAVNGATGAIVPQKGSLMEYALSHYPTEATALQKAFTEALSKVDAMKRPFVLYYEDASAGEAIKALNALNSCVKALSAKFAGN